MKTVTGNSAFQVFPKRLSGILDRFKRSQMSMAILIAVILFITGGFINSNFLSPTNIGSILSMAALLGFAAAGQTLVVISGGEGIDLSVGSVMSLGAIIGVEIMNGQDGNIIPALLVTLAAGTLVGMMNAAGIILTRVPPLVMTLAMSNVVTTVQLIYSGGTPKGLPAKAVTFIGTSRLLPILPWLAVLGIIAIIMVDFLLKRTVYGRQLFAVGNNLNAAYLSGIHINWIRGLAYMLSGMLSALGGFWLCAYNHFVYVNIAASYTLPAVAAVVIGGTSLAGGKGSYSATMVGAVVLTVLGSLLVMLKTDEAGRQIINGIVLILLLAAYTRQPSVRQ